MIGFEMLGKVIHDKNVSHPSEILSILSNGIEATFSRHVRDPLLKEGIDLGLVMVDKRNKKAEFAGAFSTLYLIRDNRLTEVKGNRMTVGVKGAGPDNEFLNHHIDLEDNDRIYLFSDGFPDQFGGPKGKKFMYRRFKHLLLTIHEIPMKQQMKFLKETLKLWMGETGQVDDIQVIGMQPLK
jgi:serine phosphatase RsbU (regulator of sigma subunit)